MATRGSARSPALAAEAWQLLLDYLLANRDRHMRIAGDFGLTLGDMKTLVSLDPDQPKPMGALAEDWKCDASNVTWLVDRLEDRGLVERRTSATDRRVKTVVLTALGQKTKVELLERIHHPPDELLALPRADLEALVRALEKLLPRDQQR
ncbi:MAG: MarR family transcriptional regulator [Actinomycetota bacterium]|nr:MarR family transcriptional regulator [Actinomycetota bacterium]